MKEKTEIHRTPLLSAVMQLVTIPFTNC